MAAVAAVQGHGPAAPPQASQVPETHALPSPQSLFVVQSFLAPGSVAGAAQRPALQTSPLAQGMASEHVVVQPAAGHWMGLSEIVALGDDRFAVLERDNAFGPKAFKTIQSFSVKGLKPAAIGAGEIPTVTKTLLRDLTPDLTKTQGQGLEKIEGMTVDKDGNLFVVSDNDGVDDSSGETQFFAFGRIGN